MLERQVAAVQHGQALHVGQLLVDARRQAGEGSPVLRRQRRGRGWPGQLIGRGGCRRGCALRPRGQTHGGRAAGQQLVTETAAGQAGAR